MTALSSKLEYYKKGETIPVTVARLSNGEYKEVVLSLTLGDLPEEEDTSSSTPQENSEENSNDYYNYFPFQMNP